MNPNARLVSGGSIFICNFITASLTLVVLFPSSFFLQVYTERYAGFGQIVLLLQTEDSSFSCFQLQSLSSPSQDTSLDVVLKPA